MSEVESVLTEDQIKTLYDTIEFDPNQVLQAIEYPKDAVLLEAEFHLQQGSLSLKQFPHGTKTTLGSVVFTNSTLKFFQRPTSFVFSAILGTMTMYDGSTPGTLYPNLIRAKKRKLELVSEIKDNSEDSPFFEMLYEHNPLDLRATSAATVKMLPLEVVYNPAAVSSIVSFFSTATKQDALDALMAVAEDTFQGLKTQTRSGLEYAIQAHKTLDLKLEVEAPIFVFPERYFGSFPASIFIQVTYPSSNPTMPN